MTLKIRTVQRARKQYRCDWCNQAIEPGESYKTWFDYDERVSARLHPECYDAMLHADLLESDLLIPGVNPRGCNCEFDTNCEWCGGTGTSASVRNVRIDRTNAGS